MKKSELDGYYDGSIKEGEFQIENIGWTLGNDCPYKCPHCYSYLVRNRGRDMQKEYVDRIVDQLSKNKIKTVNLGGNEPIFTNGLNVKNTLLPYIIESLVEKGIIVGLTTAGVTLHKLYEQFTDYFYLLNDVDISLDSPFAEEHNNNRGANLFHSALKASEICQKLGIEHTFVMCAMNWNLSNRHLDELIRLAKQTGSNLRLNYLKPTEKKHFEIFPSAEQFYQSAEYLIDRCNILEMGEPLLSSIYSDQQKGCPCGTKSFRIHSITPGGEIPVSPCVYMHEYRYGNLLEDELKDIINSVPFRLFRQRRYNPGLLADCNGCKHLYTCRGGCAARASLANNRDNILTAKDPYCLADYEKKNKSSDTVAEFNNFKTLVHRDYLCTLILSPK